MDYMCTTVIANYNLCYCYGIGDCICCLKKIKLPVKFLHSSYYDFFLALILVYCVTLNPVNIIVIE